LFYVDASLLNEAKIQAKKYISNGLVYRIPFETFREIWVGEMFEFIFSSEPVMPGRTPRLAHDVCVAGLP